MIESGLRTILGGRSSQGRSHHVIFGFPTTFPADAIELAVADVDAARRIAGDRIRPLETILARRLEQLRPLLPARPDSEALLDRCANAIRIAYVRMARRHGTLGEDFHAYHNETHILDILGPRIDRLISTHGVLALGLRDWCVLNLFAACHDLRQREESVYEAGVGANERASTEETFRLLDRCGFSRSVDADIYLAMDLTIAGSTFDLDSVESAQPVLGFLTDGQDRFFFDLHRFNSELGRQSFGSAKDDNAARLKSLSLGLRARIAMRGRPESGRQVLNAYAETVAGLV